MQYRSDDFYESKSLLRPVLLELAVFLGFCLTQTMFIGLSTLAGVLAATSDERWIWLSLFCFCLAFVWSIILTSDVLQRKS